METEIAELRSQISSLCSHLKEAEERYDERNVVISNLQASFDRFTERDQTYFPTKSVNTPKSATMAVSTVKSTIDPSIYYSLTSCLLESGASRSDRESAYEEFMSLLSGGTVVSYKTASDIRISEASDLAGLVGGHNNPSNRPRSSTRQIFVRGLTSTPSLVINLERFNFTEDLCDYLHGVTNIHPDQFSLNLDGRPLKNGMPVVDIPENVTITATISTSTHFDEFAGQYGTRRLRARNSQFTAYSCSRAYTIMLIYGQFEYEYDALLFELSSHYKYENCQVCCTEFCRATVLAEMKMRSENFKRQKASRIRHRSIQQIFRYQGLDLYPS